MRSRRTRRLRAPARNATALLAALLAACGDGVAPPNGGTPELVFVTTGGHVSLPSDGTPCEQDCDTELFAVGEDGRGLVRLTANDAQEINPAWSPDGRSVAFSSNRDGNYEIYVMSADGSGVRRLTVDGGADLQPAWSPDGQWIAFTSERGGFYQVYVMRADGSDPVRLADRAGWQATWSPDGQKIAFTSSRGGGSGLWVIGADGTGAAPWPCRRPRATSSTGRTRAPRGRRTARGSPSPGANSTSRRLGPATSAAGSTSRAPTAPRCVA